MIYLQTDYGIWDFLREITYSNLCNFDKSLQKKLFSVPKQYILVLKMYFYKIYDINTDLRLKVTR